VRDLWLPSYVSVNVEGRDVAPVQLHVGTDSDLWWKEWTSRDGDPARYSNRRLFENWVNRGRESTYLEDR
jgi:hypothetical protein